MKDNETDQMDLSGLDFDFLRYIDVRPEGQREIQKFYLPYFQHCNNVVDLGCGDGNFVQLLLDHEIPAIGVDSDPKGHAAAAKHDLPIIRDDVFHYLDTVPGGSVDGIFCAHLVEHLPYEKVVELVHLSFEALAPGGVIVLATPDVRSLYSHLEMFYLHFGHISFYHPRLLCFFLEHAGFTDTEYGANPETASPLMPALDRIAKSPSIASEFTPITYRRDIPLQGNSLIHRASYALKRRLAHWLIQPFLDDLTLNFNQAMDLTRSEIATDLSDISASMQSLNGPFECYAIAYRPHEPASVRNEPHISR